jgi:hypothetical protein
MDTETAQIVISFLGGGALGGLLTAAYSASQQRSERFRDRMLAAAEGFLVSVDGTLEAIHELDLATDEFLEKRRVIGDALKQLDELFEDEEELEEFTSVARLLRAAEDAFAHGATAEDEGRMREEAAEVRSLAERNVADLKDFPEKEKAVRTLFDAAARYAPSAVALLHAQRNLIVQARGNVAQLARVRIQFAGGAESVTAEAVGVLGALARSRSAVTERFRKRAAFHWERSSGEGEADDADADGTSSSTPTPELAPVITAAAQRGDSTAEDKDTRTVEESLQDFGARVNEHVRRRWL